MKEIRYKLQNEFQQQFGYHFSDGWFLLRAMYRRSNGLKDNHCNLNNETLEKEAQEFLKHCDQFPEMNKLIDSIINSDINLNLKIALSMKNNFTNLEESYTKFCQQKQCTKTYLGNLLHWMKTLPVSTKLSEVVGLAGVYFRNHPMYVKAAENKAIELGFK